MGNEDLESRVESIFNQATPPKAKRQVRPIFLVLLILALSAPLAISQVTQEPANQTINTYPVPQYQSQARPAVMQSADGPIYIQPTRITCVGCSFHNFVKPVRKSDNGFKKI